MKILGYLVGGAVGLFLLMLAIGASISPEESKRMAKEKHLEEICDKAMADSALGSERRMTRQVCESAKEQLKSERK
jgi:hypothetical protein